MREILFRGKRVDNRGWSYGTYVKATQHWHKNGVHKDWIVETAFANGGWFNVSGRHAVDPETVGQYTGLKDKNGKKIFEGDILREPPGDDWEKKNFVGFEVFYHDNDSCDSHVGWQMNRLHFYGALCGADIYPRSFRPAWTNRMEVIGNIHDNPELIGG